MMTILKAVLQFVYEVMFETNAYDQERIAQALRIQYTAHTAW